MVVRVFVSLILLLCADCDQIGNKAAYIIFKADGKPDIRTFEAVPHPKVAELLLFAYAALTSCTCDQVPVMAYGNSSPFGM